MREFSRSSQLFAVAIARRGVVQVWQDDELLLELTAAAAEDLADKLLPSAEKARRDGIEDGIGRV